jgi:hypothetical protein
MFARGGKIFVIALLVLTTGAHWAALQTVAWSTMLANNLRHDSFAQALGKTFDGDHPCCLCKAIATAKNAEKKSEAASPVLKMEFLPVAGKEDLFPPARFELLSLKNFFGELLAFPPPLPPPRARFV